MTVQASTCTCNTYVYLSINKLSITEGAGFEYGQIVILCIDFGQTVGCHKSDTGLHAHSFLHTNSADSGKFCSRLVSVYITGSISMPQACDQPGLGLHIISISHKVADF